MSEAAKQIRREYDARLATRGQAVGHCTRTANRISNARLAVFAAGVAAAGLAFGADRIDGAWVGLPAAAFAVLVVMHDRVLTRQRDAERAVAYYEGGVARLEHRFAGRGSQGDRFRDPQHPYAEDLDLFGVGSLFELLCRARTRRGEEVLAAWLLAPTDPDAVRGRQVAVAELRERLDLREELARVGEAVAAELHSDSILAWGRAAISPPSPAVRIVAAGFGMLSAGLLVAWFLGMPYIPLLFVLVVQSGFACLVRRRVVASIRSIEAPMRDLDVLAQLLEILEREHFSSPLLARLRERVEIRGLPASRRIAQLRRLVNLLDARRNQLFAPLGALVLFTTQITLSIDAWRVRHGASIEQWLTAVAELEALASLATHAAEHPDDCIPAIVSGSPRLEASHVGHPLLAESECVRNDVWLDADRRVLLVSGSNMSGKSTLLRTLGLNAVLALAGGTARARRLELTPVFVGTSIRVVDSLQEGSSRFYAEITRLHRIVEATREALPVLFLLDEILHGTNSHDRQIGAEAVLRSLVERGAIGLVTTHDLAITRPGPELAPYVTNVHFQDHLEEGRMHFDFQLRSGVVTKSNAIELMRSVGLDV